jgi:hypothetical protein
MPSDKKSGKLSKVLYTKAFEMQAPYKELFKETNPVKVPDFIAEADFIAGNPKALYDLSNDED